MRILFLAFLNFILVFLFTPGCQVSINPLPHMYVYQGTDILISGSGSFDFGNIYVDSNNSSVPITIKNTGKADIKLTGTVHKIDIRGDVAAFTVDTSLLKSKIPPNRTAAFAIIFNPKSEGLKTATISIPNNDELRNPYTFTIIGTGVTPEISVKQGSINLASDSSIYNFDKMYVGYSGADVTFTIENTGTGDLHLTGSPDIIAICGSDAAMFSIKQSSTSSQVEPESSTSFQVSFEPTTFGNTSAIISIENNDLDENPFRFTITGLGIDPGIVVQDSSLNAIANGTGSFDFRNIIKNETIDETFSITNLGKTDLILTGTPKVVITGSGASAFEVTSQPTSPILPSKSSLFSIKFLPNASTIYSATVSISNNDYNDSPYTFTIKGTGVEPEINIQDSSSNNIVCGSGSFDFSDVNVNSSDSETFTIQNIGSADLVLSGSPKVTISGSGAAAFSVTTQPSSPIQPSNNTTFTIEFEPTNRINYSATVSIPNNDLNENPYTFTVNGRGIAPEINLKQGSNNIVSGTGSYNFGNHYSGHSSSSITFTIENLGNMNLNLTGSPDLIAKSGTHAAMFTINQSSTTTPVTPSGSTTFSIVFRPSSTGNKSATILIANDDFDENPYTFTVSGTGIPPAPEINIKQGSNNIPSGSGNYNFGGVRVGESSSARTFTIENTGVLNLYLPGSPIVELTGTNASEFSLNTGLTNTPISSSSSTTFTITFSPIRLGNKTATISIANNDTDENPYTFTITGTGVTYIKGDYNGDGYQDIIVGANEDDDGGWDAGCAYIFFGHSNWISSIDASNADVKLLGEDNGNEFGWSVSSAGDVNNDGLDDVIVGAWRDDDGGSDSGCAFIFFGRQNWNSSIDASNADVKLIGGNSYDYFGWGVSSAGDVNNDSYDDVIVGAYCDDDGGTDSGCAFIFFGSSNWNSSIDVSNADVKLIGADINDHFGCSVSSIGDVNKDGYDDAIVGANLDNDGGSDSGCAFIFFGKQNWNSSIDASDADVKLIGENSSNYFGICVASAGDVNNDGYEDVLVGANLDDDGGSNSGCAFVFFGKQNWNSIIDASNADVKLIGEDTNDEFGISVSSASDVNNDGYDDVIVGANQDDDGGGGSGCAFIFFGRQNWNSSIDASNAEVKLIGEDASDIFGSSVSSAGDVNNDGYDEIIVGAWRDDDGGSDSGCAFIFFGSLNWNSTIDASNADVKLIGEDAGDYFGCSVSGGK